jgi:hypothetical protein
MHIRNCHIQKTQPSPHSQEERKREGMVYKMTISKQTPQTINKKLERSVAKPGV